MGGFHTTSTWTGGHWEDWARGASWLHGREARAKILAALALLIGLSLAASVRSATLALVAWLLVIATGTAGLPMLAVVLRAAAVLPFALTFALMTWLGGDAGRAQLLVAKSFLSAWTVVLLMATTPLGAITSGLQRLGVPVLIAEVILMLVRYLSVLAERAASLRRAAASRGASAGIAGGWGRAPWSTARHRGAGAGMIASLFRDAMERATRVHHAMLARGYQGRFPSLKRERWSVVDSVLVLGAVAVAVGTRWMR